MTTGRERCPPCLREKPSGLFAAYPRQSPSAIMTSRGKSWLGWGCHQYAQPSASTTGPIGQGCQCAPRPLSSRLTQHWLMDGELTAAQVTERVVVDRLLRALPHPHRQAVSMRNPKTMLELAEAIELVEAAHRREAGERAPLWSRRVVIPLPIIEMHFERIVMDLVGPLPKSAWGHEHILVIVDYATRYPKQ